MKNFNLQINLNTKNNDQNLPIESNILKQKANKKLSAIEFCIDSMVGELVNPSTTVIVTGFWRSGTTWLLETLARCLQAKSVFEPFYYEIEPYRASLEKAFSLPSVTKDHLNLFMPSAAKSGEMPPPLRSYCTRALVASIPGTRPRRSRPGYHNTGSFRSAGTLIKVLSRLRESVRTAVVAKFVRGQLLIPMLHDEFSSPLIHLRRDPRAIIASFRRHGWRFHHSLSLEEQLLYPNDYRTKYFQSWKPDIKYLDKKDPDMRLAAYWALTEQFVEDINDRYRTCIQYEKVCQRKKSYIKNNIKEIIHQTPSNEDLEINSSTTYGQRRQSSYQKRIDGWKNELESSVIEKIEKVILHLNADHLLFQ